jgi:hypothetical protein
LVRVLALLGNTLSALGDDPAVKDARGMFFGFGFGPL